MSEIPRHVAVGEAIDLVLASARALDGTESLPVTQALGRSLARPLQARWSIPTAPVSIMDGYAVRSDDLAGRSPSVTLPLAGESAAGHPFEAELAPGSTVRISTGAVVPPGADAVVAQEDVERHDDAVVFGTTALAEIRPGRHVRAAGSDLEEGEVLLGRGARLGPGALSLLAGAGHAELAVIRRPRVALLCTGDELVAPGVRPGPGQVPGTNGLMLAAQVERAGGEPIEIDVARDDLEATVAGLERALEADLVVTSGGISVGDHDHVLPALERLGFRPGFRKVRLRPGKPTTFGHVGEVPVLALPGNPASTYVTFELFVRPVIAALLADPRADWRPRLTTAVLAAPIRGTRGRETHARARRREDGRIEPLPQQLSGALRSIAAFDHLVIVPEGTDLLPEGTAATVLPLGDG